MKEINIRGEYENSRQLLNTDLLFIYFFEQKQTTNLLTTNSSKFNLVLSTIGRVVETYRYIFVE